MKYKILTFIILQAFTARSQSNLLPNSGSVGIGTLTPTQTLDVRGIIKWGNSNEFIYSGQDAMGAYIEQKGTDIANSRLRIQTSKFGDAGNYSYFLVDPSNGFTFNSWGGGNSNVGIGVTTPIEKLEVNGKIRAREIKVEVDNWPDYVFDQDYKILGLQELDAYIKANKHLPEIPSAHEVSKNGIELGEMNKLLLKKIEELTIYLIEQNKQINKLKQDLSVLKK